MLKTDKQLLIEAQNPGKEIRDILIEALERHRGRKNITVQVAAEMNVSHATIYDWCAQHNIDLSQYR